MPSTQGPPTGTSSTELWQTLQGVLVNLWLTKAPPAPLDTIEPDEEALRANLSEHFFELEKPKGSQLAETLGTDDSTLTLALLNCQVWPPGGDGVESRIVYLPLNAIDSWWIGSQSRLKGRRQGSFFAGVLVPIDGE